MLVESDWKIFEVFIASPVDLERERNAVERAIQEWNASVGQTTRTILLSRRWEELAPQLKTKAQDYINQAQVARADILIAFFSKRAGKGTLAEINLFVSMGKSQGAMVYFAESQSQAPELKQVKERLEKSGLIGKFKHSQDLAQKVKRDLTSRLEELRKYTRHSWPRLKSAVADIQNHAPYLLAHFLTEELLRIPTREIERLRYEVQSFTECAGYPDYRATVHEHLKTEKGRKLTRVFAICGEKGLRDDDQALEYFREFYTFPDLRFPENQVFRVFVQQQRGRLHRPITRKVIKQHRYAKRVVALEVSRRKRVAIDEKFPGLCTALDEGFGVVLFVQKDRSKLAIVHQGVRQNFTFAVFEGHTNIAKHLLALTYELYRASKQYNSKRALRKEIDSLFNRFSRAKD